MITLMEGVTGVHIRTTEAIHGERGAGHVGFQVLTLRLIPNIRSGRGKATPEVVFELSEPYHNEGTIVRFIVDTETLKKAVDSCIPFDNHVKYNQI